MEVIGPINLNKSIPSGVAIFCDDDEALWYNGIYFSWGFGGNANYFADNVGIGTTIPAVALDVASNKIRIQTASTPTSGTGGYTGEMRWDANYIYICTSGDGPGGSADTWKRASLSLF